MMNPHKKLPRIVILKCRKIKGKEKCVSTRNHSLRLQLLLFLLFLLLMMLILLLLLLLLLWPCLLLLITLYLVVINECCSEAHGAHVELVWWDGVVGWMGFAQSFSCQLLVLDWTGLEFDKRISHQKIGRVYFAGLIRQIVTYLLD